MIPLAARIMCSSSKRFIFLENRKPSLWREVTTKRTGLTQPPRVLFWTPKELEYFPEWPGFKNALPFSQDGRNIGLLLLDPSFERCFGFSEQFWLLVQHSRNIFVQGETAPVNPFMGSA